MMAKQAEHRGGWGLEIGGSAVRLVRLVRAGSAFEVDRFHRAEIAPDADVEAGGSGGAGGTGGSGASGVFPGLAAALGSLPLAGIGSDEPLAVCVADDAVLYRRLSLPEVDAVALHQMVRAQMEVLLPLPPERLAWGWAWVGGGSASGQTRAQGRSAGAGRSGPVLVCAARREATQVLSAASVPRRPDLVVPSALAAGAAVRRFFASPDDHLALVDVADHTTTLLLMGPGGPLHAGVLNTGGEDLAPRSSSSDADERAARLAAWQRELTETYRQLMQETGDTAALRGCVVIGRGSRAAGVAQGAAAALGTSLMSMAVHPELIMPLDAALDEKLPALGAALQAMAPSQAGPVIALGDGSAPAEAASRRRAVSARMVIAAAVILAAIVGLYVMDLRYADRIEARAAALRTQTDASADAARMLAVGQYLQRQPAPPLLVLEAMSASASPRTQLTQWQYDSRGHVRASGKVRGVTELDRTLNNLTASPPLDEVELRSANVERDTWSFEIEASLLPLHRYVARAQTQAQRNRAGAADGGGSGTGVGGGVGTARPAGDSDGGGENREGGRRGAGRP